MRTRTYTVYNDPGHGWLKVNSKELIALGILDQITPFSYVAWAPKGFFVYLEEDKDAALFIKAMNEKGIPFRFKYCTSKKRYSRIRSYQPFFPYLIPVQVP